MYRSPHSSILDLSVMRATEVPMLESEQKSPHKLPVPLHKTKNGSSDNKEDNEAGLGDAAEGAMGEQPKKTPVTSHFYRL